MSAILTDREEPQVPFLKWPGGKRWAAAQITDIIRKHLENKYYEPFLGGGAVFFKLRPSHAILSDVNSDLINTYRMVTSHHNQLIELLKAMPVTREHYEQVRSWCPGDPVLLAARFLYLNRTAFGGMYRVNRAGKFNVPYGGGERTPNILWEQQLLKKAALSLSSARLDCGDFRNSISRLAHGDVAYCDPTYTVSHDNNGFVRYNDNNFSWRDQEDLAVESRSAARRGATVIVSNAHHEAVLGLYNRAECHILTRKSLISTRISARREVSEYLFVISPATIKKTW